MSDDPPLRRRKLAIVASLATAVVIGIALAASALRRTATTTADPGAHPCEIAMREIAELKGDEVDRGLLRVTDDRIYLVRGFARHGIAEFDHRGRFLRTVGREGEGPGEFTNILDLVPLPDGQLAVFNGSPPRVTVLDAEGRAVDSGRLPMLPRFDGALRLPDGRYLVVGRPAVRSAFGSPFAHVEPDGELLRYFGSNMAEPDGPLAGHVLPRLLAHHPRHGIVSVKKYHAVVERWDEQGRLVDTWTRDPEWLDWPGDPVEEHGGPYAGPPEEMLLGAQFDAAGRLWLFGQTAAKDWREGVADGRVADYAKWVDNPVEVVDVESKRVICSSRFTTRYLMGGFAGPGLVASYREDWLGRPTVTVWELSLDGV